MKKFEVGVPLEHCKKVVIEPSDELGELMIVYKFPLDDVMFRNLDECTIRNVLSECKKGGL